MRIVSMLPSATEIVCALGARDALVGVSHECDYPDGVGALPAVTRPRLRTDATSAAIDRDVRDLLARGVSVYDVDLDRLAALAPDLIVTQDQCEVCAVPLAEVERAAHQALGPGVAIVSLSPVALDDVWDDVARVAAALDRERAGEHLVRDARRRLAAVAESVAGRPRPVVACIEWLDPVMVAGNWIPELVAIAGGAYPFVAAGAPSVVTSWAAIADARPEVVVLMPCGFTIEQTRRELAALTARPEWQALAAVRNERASVVDGNAYLNRPGPRLVESAEILAALLHPAARGARVPQGAIASARVTRPRLDTSK